MRKPWFKLNKRKIGWVPVTFMGWLLTIGYLIFTVYNFFRLDNTAHSIWNTLFTFIPQTLLFTGLFSVLCYFTADNSSANNMLK